MESATKTSFLDKKKRLIQHLKQLSQKITIWRELTQSNQRTAESYLLANEN